MNTTQQRLLATGFEIARRQGLRALTVRGLAQQAGVNPGSFVYHFGTREHFIEVLIERWYGPLFEQMQLNAREGGSPRARLGALIAHLLDSVLEQGDFVGQLFMDAAAGEPAVRRFVTSLGERHIRLLLDVVAEAQSAGEIQEDEPIHVLMFVMAGVGLPALLHHGWGERHPLPSGINDALNRLAADRAHVHRRLRWALAGVSTGGNPACNDVP